MATTMPTLKPPYSCLNTMYPSVRGYDCPARGHVCRIGRMKIIFK